MRNIVSAVAIAFLLSTSAALAGTNYVETPNGFWSYHVPDPSPWANDHGG